MSEVLYRKYRPQKFEDIVGEGHVVKVLRASVERERISHAYLFSGPRGTGKTSAARIFARAINCLNSDTICKEFLSAIALDLVEIDAASSRGIDEIRALKEAVEPLPFKSRYKVFIIDEVHMLTKEAFNALLKTLEEPPRHVIFILATTEIDKVLDTIISRTQHFEFRKIAEEELELALKKITEKEKIKIDSESLGILSVLAEGSLRDAQSMLDQVLSFSEGSVDATQVRDIFGLPSRERINGMVESFLRKDAKTSFKIVREAMAENMDSAALFKLLIRNFRFLIYLKIDREFEEELKKYISEAEMAFFKKITSEFEVNDMEKILIELNFAYSNLNWAYLPELPLELAILKISQI
uniref:DNA polymerase III subunit gamma/tau n=1 Tax=Candidatus Giovannonibacteria bacterium GW2011_GWF2_42_19 TaxID=1618659 RepID=A0A0G0ZDJ7_9BACT|nr:MAG: polymerase III subunit gamma and tau protein [Candidatus Giovannonibacteria bacterium GW2011_GWF2_42_19]